MKHLFSIKIFLVNFFLLTSLLYSQDSANVQLNASIKDTLFNINEIKDAAYLSNTSKVLNADQYIWTDKRSLSEILEMQSGYIVNNLGFTQRNPMNYNGFNYTNIGVFRDGIQINDIRYLGFDVENVSTNEIDMIEDISPVSSFLYGINTGGKAVNIITKNVIQPKPFGQLRYSQDRYNTYFADAYLSQSLSKEFNIQFGLTKFISDGRFMNSEFNKWQARAKLNFYFNPDFNIKTNIYFNKIKRGLFEGLTNESNVNNNQVVDTNSNETWNNLYFDISTIAKFFKDKESLTKINLVYQNFNRQFENIRELKSYSTNVAKVLIELQQSISIFKAQSFKYIITLNARYNNDNIGYVRKDIFELFAINKLEYKNIVADASIQYSNVKLKYNLPISFYPDNMLKKFYTSGSIELGYKLINDKINILLIKGGANIYSQEYFPDWYFLNYNTLGIEYKNKDFIIELNGYYRNNIYVYSNNSLNFTENSKGMNSSIKYKFCNISLDIKCDLLDNNDRLSTFLKAKIFYEKRIFNDMDLILGFDFKKYYNVTLYAFNMEYNELYISSRTNTPPFQNQNIFNIDFHLGAKIKNLNVNLTLKIFLINSIMIHTCILIRNAAVYWVLYHGVLLSGIS